MTWHVWAVLLFVTSPSYPLSFPWLCLLESSFDIWCIFSNQLLACISVFSLPLLLIPLEESSSPSATVIYLFWLLVAYVTLLSLRHYSSISSLCFSHSPCAPSQIQSPLRTCALLVLVFSSEFMRFALKGALRSVSSSARWCSLAHTVWGLYFSIRRLSFRVHAG